MRDLGSVDLTFFSGILFNIKLLLCALYTINASVYFDNIKKKVTTNKRGPHVIAAAIQ